MIFVESLDILRSGILRWECVVMKQTQMYICTLKEFISSRDNDWKLHWFVYKHLNRLYRQKKL